MSEAGITAHCWACGYRYDSHDAIGPVPARPKPGDASVCIQCGELATYAVVLGQLTTRKPTASERELMLANPLIVKALTVWRDAFPNLRSY